MRIRRRRMRKGEEERVDANKKEEYEDGSRNKFLNKDRGEGGNFKRKNAQK